MSVKLVCLKCKKEKELTENELNEVAAFINNKDMKAVKILGYFNLADGETCEGGKEHRYGWDHEFLKQITEKTLKIKETDNKVNQNTEEITNISNKVVELQTQMFNLQTENDSLQKEVEEESFNIVTETGVAWKRWL